MNQTTLAMKNICSRWSGRFSDAMNQYADRCAQFDQNFTEINQALQQSLSSWNSSALQTEQEFQQRQQQAQSDHRRRQDKLQALMAKIGQSRDRINAIGQRFERLKMEHNPHHTPRNKQAEDQEQSRSRQKN